MNQQELHHDFISQSVFRMEENATRIQNCLLRLTDEEVWKRPNAASNCVGNLVLHLCGNITQYILSSLGGKPDLRKRDEEFLATGGFTRNELTDRISVIIRDAIHVINTLTEQSLLQRRSVQGFSLTGTGIVIHVVEHLSYHTGQIAQFTKLLKNEDLGFYSGVNLNIKNE